MRQFFLRLFMYSFTFAIILPVAFILTHEFVSYDFKKNLRMKSVGYLGARLADLDTIKDVDVLVLGSSHTYRAIDPRNFKPIKVFTLGSSAQTPLQTLFFIKKYVNKLQPDLVLWEVYNKTFTGDGLESAIDIAANIELDKDALTYLLKQNEVRVYLSLFNNWYDDDPIITAHEEANGRYIPGGFVERIRDKYHNKKMIENITPSEFRFDEKQLEAFENGIMRLKNMGIKVLLFRTPVTKPFYRQCTNQDEVDAYFQGIVQQYGLSGYINFNKSNLNLIDTLHFYDKNHLNQNGANRLNIEIKKVIAGILNKDKPSDIVNSIESLVLSNQQPGKSRQSARAVGK